MADPDRVRLLVLGMKWPPETFLERLLGGLAIRGCEVTIAGSARPRGSAFSRSGFRWLTIPSWEAALPLRLLRLAGAVGAAAVRSTPDLIHISHLASQESGAAGRLWRADDGISSIFPGTPAPLRCCPRSTCGSRSW
jgi:hypothetical protein